LKVLLITSNYPPIPGGVSRYLKGLVDCAAGEIAVAGVDTQRPIPHSRFKALDRLMQILWSRQVAKNAQPNVAILAGQPHIALGVWLAGRDFSLTLHGGEWEDHPFARRLLRKIMNRSTHILTSSFATAEEWVSNENRGKTLSLTPGLPDFGKRLLDTETSFSEELDQSSAFKIFTVSRSSPRKGTQKLVNAIQMCRSKGLNVTLTVSGQSQGATEVDSVIGGVTFLGHISDDELVSNYAQAHAFALLPERIKGGEGWEGFGIVYLEAAAAGLPIIASDTGGVREAITPDGSILLNANCTVESIAQTIEALVANVAIRKRMSETNRVWAKSNQWSAKQIQVQSVVREISGQ
jgi:glycosyltransferase involved in cell wall biosynthesis